MNALNRRHFLKHASVPAISTLLNLKLAGYAAADTLGTGDDRKSLVCIFFGGGMDGFHLLCPRDDARYADYQASRSNLAHRQDQLLTLTDVDGGTDYGLHPKVPELRDMFNGTGDFTGNRCASFVSNIGTLIKPLTKQQYLDGTPGVDSPVGVGGHARQSEQWQTVIPQGTVDLNGWLGRAADLVQGAYNRDKASMNLSLSGNNLMQVGDNSRPFTFRSQASLGLTGENVTNPNHPLSIKNLMHRRLLEQDYRSHYVESALSEISSFSLDQQIVLQEAIQDFDESQLVAPFPRSSLGNSLKNIITLIATREQQGLCRQTFFASASGGWDHHFELPKNFEKGITDFSECVSAFQKNLIALKLDDSVVSFTASEFARSLRSTGAGSDHAWGGPQMIFGTPIKPGKIFGPYPDLALDSNNDVGRGGRILPETSCDEYYADMLRWFGLDDDMLDIVLPNYDNFRNGRTPLGYIAT